MPILNKVLLISGIILLVGCTPSQRRSELYTSTPVTIPTYLHTTSTTWRTLVPTSTQTRTSTPTSQAPTNNPASSTTDVIQNCVKIQSYPPIEQNYRGIIALESYPPQVNNPISFYNFDTKQITEFTAVDVGNISISPDRTKFAYRNWKGNLLEIFSADQQRIKSLAVGKYWGDVSEWLDNKNVVITMNEPEPDTNSVKYPRNIIVVNPFSNQVQTLISKYPDIDQANSNFSWPHGVTTVYDPTLSRVVYPGYFEHNVSSGNPQPGYILYSIPENKKLAFIPNVYWVNREPLWSPDGTRFLMMGEAEFYLVSKEGEISKITRMNPDYNQITREGNKLIPIYYNWSPDGQRVALWLGLLGTDQITLAILDVNDGKITDTCIQAGYNPKDVRIYPYPVWSPDGKNLIVATNFRSDEVGNDVVLINLDQNVAYKITTNFVPIGWLISQ